MRPNQNNHNQDSQFEEKVIQVNRVSKKTKGGNKIGFSVLVVVGDKAGRVGVGLGKGPDVLSSIKKAVRRGKKRMITLPLLDGTIPFPIQIKRGAAELLLKPAPQGTGVIAGGAVRAVVEAAGVSNIVSKIMGSGNQASNVYATFAALQKVREIADLKGIKLADHKAAIVGAPTLKTETKVVARPEVKGVALKAKAPVKPSTSANKKVQKPVKKTSV
jgi:small subunit ribosomal protein S5